jgi:hypothetical protein
MPNLISTSPSPESKAEVIKCLGDIKKRLDFLTSLTPESLPDSGDAALFGKAFMAVGQHLEILPTVFPFAGSKDGRPRLSMALAPDAAQLDEIAESVTKTMRALSGDATIESPEIYRAARQRAGKVQGLAATVVEDMQVFFA